MTDPLLPPERQDQHYRRSTALGTLLLKFLVLPRAFGFLYDMIKIASKFPRLGEV